MEAGGNKADPDSGEKCKTKERIPRSARLIPYSFASASAFAFVQPSCCTR